MAAPSRKFDARIFLVAVLSGVSLQALTLPAAAQTTASCNFEGPCPPPVTDSGSSAGSIKGVVDQRFNQLITNRVLGTVLLGVNEQINCSDCISAFGSAGSFSAGIHGRKEITSNLSLLAGIAYTQYSENGYKVTDAPIGALALRYDFTDWGSSRPFFDIGTILTPFEKVSYSRGYTTNYGNVALQSSTNASEYGVYGRAGWISRMSPRDELAVSVEIWQLWQTVSGYSDPNAPFNPFNATVATGTDRTNLAKVGAQWTHLFGDSIEGNVNGGFVQSFANHSGLIATVTGDGLVAPTIGNQSWFEYGGRVGFRITKGWVADLFVNGTLGPQPVGNTIHGGVGLRVNF
ncbi:MAG TPA: hypothetical protein VFL62_07385 [Bradyrhizobium sp.]|uniref:hypothetical protein n=1 Tax=Bradyrhizobium sp. TaxID=376 RepID=UPI002D7FD945|nr:hypothetical protein [Bradyrhizobium sp.]HET7886031.1 hypothetical protein [Bradyrhizobium sp.]